MGASFGLSKNIVNQSSTNSIYQSSFNVCAATCDNVQNGTVIVIQDSKIGLLDLSQECNASALCVMKTNLEAIASQQLEAISNNTFLSPGGLFNYSAARNRNVTTQTLENTYSQTINNLCQASASNYRSNTLVLITDTEVVGAVDLSQSASAEATCAIENTASASVVQSSTAQLTNVTKTGSVIIILIVALAIVLIVIGTAYIASEQKKNDAQARTSQLEALAASGAIDKLTANEINAILSGSTLTGTPIIYN